MDPTFTTVGDEALEARIVSWVLGEASAFEAAELERLCAERPELQQFRNRIAALHGLLADAENPPKDEKWTLPAGKRKMIEELIETQPLVRSDPQRERRIGQSARKAAIAIAACVALTWIVVEVVTPEGMFIKRFARPLMQKDAMIVTYSAVEESEKRMAALQPDFPAERIEGTPKPIVLPEHTLGKDALAMAERKVQTTMERKPASPSSSMANAVTSGVAESIAVPVPEIAMNTPSLDFGRADDFGDGWKDGAGSGGGSGAAPAAKRPAREALAMADEARQSEMPAPAARPRPAVTPAPAEEIALNEAPGQVDPFAAGGEGASSNWFAAERGQASAPDEVLNANSKSGTAWLNTFANGQVSPGPTGGFKQDLSEKANAEFLFPTESDGTTAGNRSGDGAISRHSIDAVLNNPNRGSAAAATVAEAEGLREVGEYAEARQSLERALVAAPDNQEAKDALATLDDPIRTNPALTYEHTREDDRVRRNLYVAEGNFELGKLDEAKKSYEDVLRTDPYNSAARRGMERVNAAKTDYYRAAYDHTRAELLSEVDKSWELNVPAEEAAGGKGKSETTIELAEQDGQEAEALGDIEGFVQFGAPIATAKEGEEKPMDDARKELLDAVDRAWDLAAPAVADAKGKELAANLPLFKTDAEDITAKVAEEIPNLAPQKALPVTFEEETSAAEDPFSTFSLNISDASFRIAQAALAKGEQPDPAGIKVEQFYNAFDYGDPAPATGQPVACAIEQVGHPVIPGRNLVRIAIKTAAAGRSAGQPLRLTLLVDQSGSMTRGDRREAMDQALEGLAGLLTAQDQVNVVGFSRTSRLIAEGLPGDKAAAQLAEVVNPSASEGGTNMETAINLAIELALRHKVDGAQNRIVLFTDGAANLGDADPERLAAKVEQLRQQGLALDIAGIAAEDINDRLLAELARKGNGRYHIVGKGDGGQFAKQLAGAFRPAAENVKVQVRFNPERVKGYKLLGFEKDRLKTEDFRNDAVDAAEMAAEEAGVAIYQVEPIPDGKGEIGEVSVRFRETASGDMVERSWVVSHDPSTPALDRAPASMQLATLALFAGEKLKGGPLGAAIDFQTLATVQAAVKQAFGHDARIGELLRMIDALK